MAIKLRYILLLTGMAWGFNTHAQLAPDFTITDSQGNEHTLYADYLNQGKTVLIEIFFTTCPPCNSIAPYIEPLYQEWGGGDHDVEFFDLSDKSFDTDALVNSYSNNHGHTYPAAGSEGGSLAAVAPYKQGMFGPFYGTPTFIVIAPDGTVQYDVDGSNNSQTIEALDAAIEATGATRPECIATYNVDESYCEGDSVQVNGTWYNEPGIYTDTIENQECDSLLWITITELPLQERTINASFCANESFQYYGTTYTQPGVYEIEVDGIVGCDTLVTLNLSMTPLPVKSVTASFQAGDSVLVYGQWYDEEDTYQIIVPSVTNACDTIVTIHIFEAPDIPIDVTIHGFIRTAQSNVGIAGTIVTVKLNGNIVKSDTTNAQGEYTFTFDSTYVANNDLQIEVSKTLNPLNGISVLDLVALQKHLLGLDLLNSVEKLFAADVNRSGSISALDIVYMRRLLLGFEDGFPTADTWRFFHTSQTFGPPLAQPPVLEVITISVQNIANGTQSPDFRGIKLGDLNNSANPLN